MGSTKRYCCTIKQLLSLVSQIVFFALNTHGQAVSVRTSHKKKMEQMKYLTIAVLTLLGAHFAAAESVTYVCNMTKQDDGGWIAP
ncbi:hypothetical protein [Ruegeria arenilitoris]|uniref:hypothetical protein n=1 Tax=Ruegeria arenilitoris TaxID=1173585 RepID=UPI001C2CB11F|nr:hypothetical protein [Ruegeria arenilitoris]